MTRARSGLRLAVLASVVLAVSAVGHAADRPLPGKLLLIRDTKVAKVIARSTGTPFAVPAPGGPNDPRTNPSSLLIDDLGGAGGALSEADLAPGLWRGLGSPAGSKG